MARQTISVPFNNQQLTAIDSLAIGRGLAPSREEVVRLAVSDTGHPDALRPRQPPGRKPAPAREIVESHVIAPGTGKGIVVRTGQSLRIQQIDGGQCVDFNCYNLANRNEALHVGRTRSVHGVSPVEGDLLWSKAPWERPLMAIASSNAVTDLLYPCCSSLLYRLFYRDGHHTNCQQIQEEAPREFGIPPYGVHESFNTFMCVEVYEGGGSNVVRNSARAGDHIDLYAVMDVLAIPNVCGDDLDRTNNFALKPVSVQVMSALDEDHERARAALARYGSVIAPEFNDAAAVPVRRDPAYVPDHRFHVESSELAVTLDADQASRLEALWDRDLYGDDLGAALWDVVMSWLLTKSFHD